MPKIIKELIPYLIIIIVVVLFRTFIATPIRVNGGSMEPTLNNKDIMILNKLSEIERFNIIVFKYDNDKLIKRVIGMPGETIEILNGILYINDEIVKDPYYNDYTGDIEKIKLNSNEYYVLGDNREVSKDSRIIGPINKNKIMGKTNFVLYPFSKIGKVE